MVYVGKFASFPTIPTLAGLTVLTSICQMTRTIKGDL